MKKVIVLFLLFLCANSFSEEITDGYKRSSENQPSEQMTRLPLIRNTANLKNTSGYEFLDGEQLSFGDFRSLMYGYPDSKRYMKRAEFWRVMTLVSGIVFFGTFFTALSTDSEEIATICTLSSMCSFELTAGMGYITIYHKAKSADFYNMHIIDEELDYIKHKETSKNCNF